MPDVGDRREVILAQAGKLFARKGVSATTVREIGEAAGILSGSLYHHFESKEAMVDEILAEYLEDLQHSYSQVLRQHDDPKECLAGLIAASFHAIEAHRDACEIYQNDFNYLSGLPRFSYLKKRAAELQKAWVEVILAGVEAGRAPLRRRPSGLLPLCPRRRLADRALVQAGWPLPHRRAGRRVHQDPDGGLCRKRPVRSAGSPEPGSPPPSQAKAAKPAKAVKTGSKAR